MSRITGQRARRSGNEFERLIGASFEGYAKAGIAYLDWMPVPMTPCGLRHPVSHVPLYIPRRKAPFDIYGYRTVTDGGKSRAIFVGAELKSTSEHLPSLAIIRPQQRGAGLQYHQLASLAQLAASGGEAYIVWDNGGIYGLLDGQAILVAKALYDTTLRARSDVQGRRSVPWGRFRVVNFDTVGGVLCLNWLPGAAVASPGAAGAASTPLSGMQANEESAAPR